MSKSYRSLFFPEEAATRLVDTSANSAWTIFLANSVKLRHVDVVESSSSNFGVYLCIRNYTFFSFVISDVLSSDATPSQSSSRADVICPLCSDKYTERSALENHLKEVRLAPVRSVGNDDVCA